MWREVHFNETKEALRGLQQDRSVVCDVLKLNLVAVFQEKKSACVASVGFCNSVYSVAHCGALIGNFVVVLDVVAVCVMIVRVEHLNMNKINNSCNVYKFVINTWA